MNLEILREDQNSNHCMCKFGNLYINPTLEMIGELSFSEENFDILFTYPINNIPEQKNITYHLLGNKHNHELPAKVYRQKGRVQLELSGITLKAIPNVKEKDTYSLIVFNGDKNPTLIINNILTKPLFLKSSFNSFKEIFHFGTKESAQILFDTIGSSRNVYTNSGVDFYSNMK